MLEKVAQHSLVPLDRAMDEASPQRCFATRELGLAFAFEREELVLIWGGVFEGRITLDIGV